MICNKCQNEMEYINDFTEDWSGNIFWCEHCGTLLIDCDEIDGEKIWKHTIIPTDKVNAFFRMKAGVLGYTNVCISGKIAYNPSKGGSFVKFISAGKDFIRVDVYYPNDGTPHRKVWRGLEYL